MKHTFSLPCVAGKTLNLSTKVTPDFHGFEAYSEARLVAMAEEKLEDRVAGVLDAGLEENERAKRNKSGSMQPYLSANVDHVKAEDNMFKQTFAVGLRYFQVVDGPQPLLQGEKRFFLPAADLPQELVLGLRGRVRRSCLALPNDDTKLECVWHEHRQSLWNCLDMGTIGRIPQHHMFYRWKLRGCELFDPIHRRARVNTNALCEAGLSFSKSEYEIVISYLHAPCSRAFPQPMQVDNQHVRSRGH